MSQSRTRPLEPHHIRLLGADGAGLRVWLEVPGSLTEEKLGRVSREISKLSVVESSLSGCLRHDAGTLKPRPRVALGMTIYGWN